MEFRKDLMQGLWLKAAGGRHGAGLTGVPDLGTIFKVKGELLKAKKFKEVHLLKLVVAASMWPEGRVAEAIPASMATGECWLCGASCCDEGHVAWGCANVREHPD
eukprot:5727831-Lingulodinium_polyedra.AAC.1